MHDRPTTYFSRLPDAPAPIRTRVQWRVAFGEVDPMGMAWHGRYASFFEAASTELRRNCGLSYPELIAAGLRMPVVRFHVDYMAPVRLDDLATVEASLIWSEAARLNIEYAIFRPDGSLATTGCTVQLFTDASTGQLLLASPDILVQLRLFWAQGKLGHLQ